MRGKGVYEGELFIAYLSIFVCPLIESPSNVIVGLE